MRLRRQVQAIQEANKPDRAQLPERGNAFRCYSNANHGTAAQSVRGLRVTNRQSLQRHDTTGEQVGAQRWMQQLLRQNSAHTESSPLSDETKKSRAGRVEAI